MFAILSYILAFFLIVINNIIADQIINWFEKDENVFVSWTLLGIILATHIFILGTGLRVLLGW